MLDASDIRQRQQSFGTGFDANASIGGHLLEYSGINAVHMFHEQLHLVLHRFEVGNILLGNLHDYPLTL